MQTRLGAVNVDFQTSPASTWLPMTKGLKLRMRAYLPAVFEHCSDDAFLLGAARVLDPGS